MIKLKKILRSILDRLQFNKTPSSEMIGEEGGSWCVNLSYLPTDRFPIMFSGGVGKDISFEQAFAERFKGKVYIYDPSPTGRNTIENLSPIKDLTFIPKALCKQNGAITMNKPQDPLEGSWTISGANEAEQDEFESVSLVREIDSLGYKIVDIVKLDIEGFEYEVIEDLLNSKIQVNQILVEFHDFFPNISKWKSIRIRYLLNRKGYICFYKHHYDFSFYKKLKS